MSENIAELVRCSVDVGFSDWMSRFPGCLAVTTYQAGKLIMVGWNGQQVTIFLRDFDKVMGLAIAPPAGGAPTRLALGTRYGVSLLADAPDMAKELPDQHGRCDALFLPRVSYHTGELHAHDLAFAADGLWMVNTRFSCLARLSDAFSFVPVWKPPFISEVRPEDRCHLNGMCVVDGAPRYVTCLGQTNVTEGWRTEKRDGGVLVDVRSGAVLARGLSMPHSPRWHANKLWLLNSGAGELLTIDPENGRGSVVCVLPGYLRGLCLVGPFALVGLCVIREPHLFGGLSIESRFKKLICGVALVDLRTGARVGLLEFTSGCTELFEVGAIHGPRQPMVMNLEREESLQAFPTPDFNYWLRYKKEPQKKPE